MRGRSLMDRVVAVKSDFDYGKNNGLGYVAVLMSFATLMEVTKTPRIWYFVLVPLGLLLTWFWGYVLRKTYFRKKENEILNRQNERFIEMHEMLKEKEKNER